MSDARELDRAAQALLSIQRDLAISERALGYAVERAGPDALLWMVPAEAKRVWEGRVLPVLKELPVHLRPTVNEEPPQNMSDLENRLIAVEEELLHTVLDDSALEHET